ncbi:MAG: hypothetical protein DRI34_12845 [Deltaproteobacteria bacterium]|nr:MAG: hypothetical protein DRI34_12845 [Deltaproteobacteria bacterium]
MKKLVAGTVVLSLLALAGGCSKKKDGQEAEQNRAQAAVSLADARPAEIPAPAVAYLAMNKPAATMAALEKLAGLAGPVPPGMLQGLLVQSLLRLGLTDTSVVDLSAPAGLLVLDPKKFPRPLLLVVSTKGEQQLLRALQPTWKNEGKQGNAYRLVREEKDTYAVFSGGAKNATIKHEVFLACDGPLAFVARQPGTLEAGLPLLKKLLATQGQDLLGGVQVDRLREIFERELSALKTQVVGEMQQNLGSRRVKLPMDVDKFIKFYTMMAEGMFSLTEQIGQVDLAARCSDQELEMKLGLRPVAGSGLANFLAQQKKQPLRLLAALPQGPFLAVGMNVQWKSLKPQLAELTAETMNLFFGKDTPPELLKLLDAMWDVMGDEFVFSEDLNEQGLTVVEAFSVTDAKRAREVFLKAFQAMADYLDGSQLMGIKLEMSPPRKIGEHRGAELLSFDMSFLLENADPRQARIMKTMYGDSMHLLLAFHEKAALVAMGKNGEQLLRQALDRLSGQGTQGFDQWPAFRSAAGSWSGNLGGFFFMSISNMITASIHSAMSMEGGSAPAWKMTPPASGLFMGGGTRNGRLEMVFRLPAEHLKEIGQAVKQLTSFKQK